jgi:hypothetical protein
VKQLPHLLDFVIGNIACDDDRWQEVSAEEKNQVQFKGQEVIRKFIQKNEEP